MNRNKIRRGLGGQFDRKGRAERKANRFQDCVVAVLSSLRTISNIMQAGLKNSRALLLGFAGLIGILVISSGMLYAQGAYGSAIGTITDPSGAVIVGATVTLTNVDTGDKRTAAANNTGNYQFVNLVPGNYKVDVENTGFKHFTRTNVVVQVQGSTRVDATLESGSVNQTVEVTSQAPLIETQQATVGQVVAGRAVSELPLNGRNVFNLLAIAPGVVPQGGTAASNAAAGQAGNGFGTGNYQISGGIPNTEAVFIDGAPINNGYINAIAYIPAQDSIQEFRIQGNNLGPEFGSTEDGAITMVTKSGTNAFHGTAYDYLRNTVLNANTFFAGRAHLKRPVFIQNQFGATLGGPIKKDKLFFFGSYEGVRAAVGATSTYSVPTMAQTMGNFSSQTAPIKDPGQFDSTGTTFIPSAPGTTFQGNMIPDNRINPTARALLAYWPKPNLPGSVNNFVVNTKTHPQLNQYILRLDWNVSEKQRIFGRYTYHRYIAPGALPFGYINNPTLSRNAVQNFVIGDSYTLSPTTILDVALSYFRDSSFSGATGIPFDLGFTQWPAATIAQLTAPVIPRISVSGFSNNGGGGQQIRVNEENYALSGNMTKILGRHTLKFGGEFRRAPNNYGQTNATFVEAFNFTNAFTGSPFASYLLGLPQSTITENATFPAAMMYYAGAFIGDTFQATSRLTINAGIRWEYPGYWTERHDRQAVFLPDETSPLAAPTGLPLKGNVELVNTPAYPHRTNVLPHYKLFSPRLGLTYQLTPRLVIRSGFSILYAPTAAIEQDAQPYQSPVNLALTQINTTTQPVNSLNNPFPGGILQTVGRSPNYQSAILGQTVTVSIPNEPATYVEQWNVDVERDLGHNTLLDIAYVADHGVHQQGPAGLNDNGQGLDQIPDQYLSMGSALLTPVPNPFYGLIGSGNLSGRTVPAGQLLRPYPQYYNLNNPASVGYFSKYASLQGKIEKRFGQGGTLLAAYTWAKNSGNADTQTGFQEGVQPGEVQDWTDLRAEVSQLSYNVPHRGVISYVVDLPFGKGKRFLHDSNGLVDRVVSGWGVDGITTFQSGFPLVFTAQPTFISSNFGAGT
ncbi:MAG: TonB-dependent receptor, partial [Edaphobacter sp.]